MKSPKRKLHDCLKCPAYCCSYEHIPVTDADIRRLGAHFGKSEAQARRAYSKAGDDETPRVIRHQTDEHFKSVCMFLDKTTRNCTIYTARPRICREFPAGARCGYYDFLAFERRVQGDPDWIATTS
ncbi:MAG: YkgJ family cysteine cluster protein [Pseudomonadota bacterium]